LTAAEKALSYHLLVDLQRRRFLKKSFDNRHSFGKLNTELNEGLRGRKGNENRPSDFLSPLRLSAWVF
jgi:hypothetical protein